MYCVRCGHERSVTAPNCPSCGAAVFGPEHRRVVTIFFADLCNSFKLIRGRDPEEAASILEPAVDEMRNAVERFGGTVMQLLGDGVYAIFGTPKVAGRRRARPDSQMQENHAANACHAALAVTAGIASLRMSARVGLHSGEVMYWHSKLLRRPSRKPTWLTSIPPPLKCLPSHHKSTPAGRKRPRAQGRQAPRYNSLRAPRSGRGMVHSLVCSRFWLALVERS
jgi:Adenylate and Guanylate cyclase catalytic domain